MSRTTIAFVTLLCLTALSVFAAAQTIKPAPAIDVTASNDAAAVRGVSDALGTLSEKVTACVNAGKKAETCRCSYPQELGALRKSYAALVRQHPEWKDQLLTYRRLDKEGRNISGALNMEGLRRQLEVLKCE